MIGTLLLFLLVLSLLVFAHEFGHFITAKKMGMKVEEFGFGFPPRLWGVRKGETIYSINWIPLGGFVKIKGESGEQKNDSDSFASKPAWRRFLVLIAGVAMNMILAAILLSFGFMAGLPTVVDSSLSSQARLSDENIRIMSVLSESPGEKAGLEGGDVLLSINDSVFSSADGARQYIQEHADQELRFVIKREETYLTIPVTAGPLPGMTAVGVGVGLVKTALVSYPWYLAIPHGVAAAGIFVWEVLRAFWNLLASLVVHQEVAVDLSGPVGIAVMTGQAAAMGFVYLLQFTAILSINLAVVNLLPFPALDGGRVFFLLIEKIRRRAVDERIEALVHNLGFVVLMGLVLLVTFRDLARFGGQILNVVKQLVGA
ncbi:MAG: Site-2 protease, Metallo peptidase, MEROPS family M50B [Candidatus Uhrbacteria bacterium GW2011_GWF2_41_16]|uniref:Zinc metalloprotease n=2 Tax=Candidatus Uhriibacteriota TaxID=1752732 RepID=A0A0G0VC98_9BACT|nr:MAG: Site-2 protease, Metallo peptidase, MEROPS family M50B [Candidatus Uhrbacteria bacterium GW2011_GWA2_41_10]KKR87559.1 MAG: Site-2 protease, Metallo peptidase, MEROPS family M50B [Candidatus Uhrbacteria bacterium GW2011_GWC2_41_11]KKR98539.1 MAG: Site-2 protease, Metallo peptidase, MEROPS family M50B [Candidatus Uhrbacteria bacterium GW2011_GWF2_41_16]HBO99924.1 RIP metalloprotease RseP [Candidatus Uhrbacteria bacterium]